MRSRVSRISDRLLLGESFKNISSKNILCEDVFDGTSQFFKVIKKLDAFCENLSDIDNIPVPSGLIHIITSFSQLAFLKDKNKITLYLDFSISNGYVETTDDSFDIKGNKKIFSEIKDFLVKEIKNNHFKDFKSFIIDADSVTIPLKEFDFSSEEELLPCIKWLNSEGFLEL